MIKKAQEDNFEALVIKQDGIKEEFNHYLDLSVADMAYVSNAYDEKMSKSVIDLIQNSPVKKMMRKQERERKLGVKQPEAS